MFKNLLCYIAFSKIFTILKEVIKLPVLVLFIETILVTIFMIGSMMGVLITLFLHGYSLFLGSKALLFYWELL